MQKKIREAENVISELNLLQDYEKSEIDDINQFYETEKNKAMKKVEARKSQEDARTKMRFDQAKEFMRQLEENQDIAQKYRK